MQGHLTFILIASLFGTLILTMGFAFLGDMGTNYNVNLDEQSTNSQTAMTGKAQLAQQYAINSKIAQDNSSIDQSVTDFAQLQSFANAEETKVDSTTIFLSAMGQLQDIINFDPQVLLTIGFILAVLTASTMVYLVIGRYV